MKKKKKLLKFLNAYLFDSSYYNLYDEEELIDNDNIDY